MKTKILLLLFIFISAVAGSQTITVVNMIPNALSNETRQDSEPHVTVNPNNPLQIIGSAFTPNATGATATAPIFISQDGGTTWTVNNNVPSSNGITGDITIGLSRNNVLYTGILFGGGSLQMRILRSNTYLAVGTMGNLLTRNGVDQPYVVTHTPLGGPQRNNDQVYVGNNVLGSSTGNGGNGRTAANEFSLNTATASAPAGLAQTIIEVRNTGGQNGPPIRTAVHRDGTVYVAFTNFEAFSSTGTNQWIISQFDVIVGRDDNWGIGATPFTDLNDPGDGLAGLIVANNLQVPFVTGSGMGQARIGDRLSIAVDPRNSQTVYLAYTDRPTGVTGNTITIHVRRSTDSGANWSGDLLTINSAIIPQLAVNIRGQIGFLYQQLTGTVPNQQWVTHYRQSSNGGTNWSDQILSQTPSNTPNRAGSPYLGDYAALTAVGKDFYGAFSANNSPNNANFPNGVNFQRRVNLGSNTLRNLANTANIAVSIDPFFFRVQQIPNNQEFYVRDWTTNSTTLDIGLEPSTNPVFYATSDVWNRRFNVPGGFNTNDQPQSQDPQVAVLGNNFAFARVHRAGTGTAETVSLHFLKSELGTGSNYVNANTTSDPTLVFASGELVKTMTSGYEWTLNNSSSTHTCLAVEINTSNDPVVTPTLIGRAPGWPDTDLSVINDNNKGQRNMGVYTQTTAPGGSFTYYAVLHNAATFKRDFVLYYEPNEPFRKHYKIPEFIFPDMKHDIIMKDDHIIIPGMEPGENQWIGIKVPASANLGDEMAVVDFVETVDDVSINGFGIGLKSAPIKEVLLESYYLHTEVFFRMGNLFGFDFAFEESESAIEKLINNNANEIAYFEYLKSRIDILIKAREECVARNNGDDPFKTDKALNEVLAALESGDPSKIRVPHAEFNHKMDAFLTYIDKQQGDLADILQNIRWQNEIFELAFLKNNISGSKELIEMSNNFYNSFVIGKANYGDYLVLTENLFGVFDETADFAKQHQIDLSRELRAMKKSLDNPQHLQKAHYDYLLKLSSIK